MGLLIFIVVLIIELATRGTIHNPDTVKDYYSIDISVNFLTAVSIILVAYSFQ